MSARDRAATPMAPCSPTIQSPWALGLVRKKTATPAIMTKEPMTRSVMPRSLKRNHPSTQARRIPERLMLITIAATVS